MTAVLAVLASLQALPAGAILTRADRDEEEYLELATRYPAAVSLGPSGGVGVLVGPRWILTAAHRASALRPKDRLAIGGSSHEVQEVFLHPEWKPGAGPDLGLVLLRTAVAGVDPVPPYRGTDEAGQAARIVGTGGTGRIGAAGGKPDGKARAAINTVDRVAAGTFAMRLKGPEDASDLQGALGPGDTGAPAFLEVGGRIFVGGIAARTEDTNGDGIAGSVGDWETYTRLSAFAAWIEGVARDAMAAEAAAAFGDSERR
jgi:hypothetical protein